MPQESGQDVKADGHGLEADELHDQVVAPGHEHHADRGKQQQRVIFAVVLVLDLQVAHREQNDQRGGDQENHPEVEKERIHDDRAVKTADGVRPQRAQPVERIAAESNAEHGDNGVKRLFLHAQ